MLLKTPNLPKYDTWTTILGGFMSFSKSNIQGKRAKGQKKNRKEKNSMDWIPFHHHIKTSKNSINLAFLDIYKICTLHSGEGGGAKKLVLWCIQ